MDLQRRRRARSAGGVSSEGSLHRHEIRVDDFEVHPTYQRESPNHGSQGLGDGSQFQSPDRPPRDDVEEPGRAMMGAGAISAEASTGEARMEAAVVPEPGERAALTVEVPVVNVGEIPDLPPGFQGDVPPGRVLEGTLASGTEDGGQTSYIARSLDSMGNVLASLLGRMASLEQRSSNRSGTPTSDGLEGQLQQLSLTAASRMREGGPLRADRPLASADKIMAGTFSSDDSDTARLRAEEARRIIPGAIMPNLGPPPQQAMGADGGCAAQSGRSAPLQGAGWNLDMMDLPPVPPSALGYFLPPERQHAGRPQMGDPPGRWQDLGATCLGATSQATMPMGPCPGMTSAAWPSTSPNLTMPGVTTSGSGPCRDIPGVTSRTSGSCVGMTGQSSSFMTPVFGAAGPGQSGSGVGDGSVVKLQVAPEVVSLAQMTGDGGQCGAMWGGHAATVSGIPCVEGQRGYVQVEGQRLPCVCFGGRSVIEMNVVEDLHGVQDRGRFNHEPLERPPPPPGPPPPTPPTTPRTSCRVPTYGVSTTQSLTPGGTPVPLSPNDIEEPSKLVNKLPCLAPVKGTAGGDAAVMAGDWLAQLAPSMATLSPGAAIWWRDLLQDSPERRERSITCSSS